MKNILIISLSILSFISTTAQNKNPNYDSTLAKTLGADDMGMKMYVLVILRTGSNTTEPKASKDSLFLGHFKNINKLVEMKKLIVAGPFEKNDSQFRGLFILDVPTFEEANKLLEGDPTIKKKIFKADLYQWYGSAALAQYLKDSDKIWKAKP